MSPWKIALPEEIESAFSRLRRGVRQYVLFEGLALLIALAGVLFWLTFVIDWAYFSASKLELPRWFRASALVVSLTLIASGALLLLVIRSLTSLRRRALALVLERRFPELSDRLVTAVEASEGSIRTPSSISSAMLDQTVREATLAIERMHLENVFDRAPLRRAIILAGVLLLSIGALAVADAASLNRWAAGFLSLQQRYWNRETVLVLKAITQPGDQIREFTNGRYLHPRGSDLLLKVEVAEGKKAPEQIRLDFRLVESGGTGRAYLSPGETHVLPGLLEDVEIWLSGGDYTSERPYRVVTVTPPAVDQISLEVRYPEYTQLNSSPDASNFTTLAVDGTKISLPLETVLTLVGSLSRPSILARIEGEAGADRFELLVQQAPAPATLVLRPKDGSAETRVTVDSHSLLSDSRLLRLPFHLTRNGGAKLIESIQAAAQAKQAVALPLPFPPDSMIRIWLEDVDGIASLEPARVTIVGTEDQPPVIETELRGIGSAITRMARIPVAGTIRDDYGLGRTAFEYQVDAGPWQVAEFEKPLTVGQKEMTLKRREGDAVEAFEVLPLDLSVKQKLSLRIVAEDQDNLNGPHIAKSTKAYTFTIVPPEELLSLLYAREINLRKRFEQILVELKQTRDDIQKYADAIKDQKSSEIPAALRLELDSCAERSLFAVRRNGTETDSIHVEFQNIREELVNNRAETPQILERLDDRIIAPLGRIIQQSFPNVDGEIGLFRLSQERKTNPAEPMGRSVAELNVLIEQMERVLAEMKELETFHKAIEMLKEIISAENAVLEETKRRRKENAIKSLE